MKYNITPCAKPRMTRADAWKKRPPVLKYWAFKQECLLKKVMCKPGDGYVFTLPMPKSWSKNKKDKMNGSPHVSRPDLDNLLKAIFDAVLPEDSHMWNIGPTCKIWGYEGSIEVVPGLI